MTAVDAPSPAGAPLVGSLFDFRADRIGFLVRTAREMDHMPISGPGGSLEHLARLPCRHRIYTHINNTNPILLEQSPERAAVVQAGLTVGQDGVYIEV